MSQFVFAQLVKAIGLSMVLMGVALSSGAPAPIAADHCMEACDKECGQEAPEEHPADHHNDDCPPTPHHHHHHSDGCIHSAHTAWLVEWDKVSLPGTPLECGNMESGDEQPPDDPVFVLDKPPLI